MNLHAKPPKIGIYAGTFNPVHAGHVGFALQSLEDAGLDEAYFLPERIPRNKTGVEHYGHRVAMLKRAVLPYATLSVMELVDKHLTLRRSLPQIRKRFGEDTKLVFLMGADVFAHVPDWPGVHEALTSMEFVVSIRSRDELAVVLQATQLLGLPPASLTIVDSVRPEVSSTKVRRAISQNEPEQGLLPSVYRYARNEWLYVRLPQ